MAVVIVAAVAAAGIALVVLHRSDGQAYQVRTPAAIGAYKQAPAIAGQTQLPLLRDRIVASGGGEARHVVAAVYEDSTGPAARSGPQFVLFIGGNLRGASASSFAASFVGKLPGAATTSPGLPASGAAAACAPGRHGALAECAWADGGTFGVVASSTLTAAELGQEMRQMRPAIERPVR